VADVPSGISPPPKINILIMNILQPPFTASLLGKIFSVS
jgi:hypothetical protein